MAEAFSSAEGMKRLALGLIGTALAAIVVVLVAGQKMVAIQGPGSLGVTGAGTLWVSVDDRLWVLDAQGERAADKSVGELGLKEPPSNIVPMPDGNVLIASRGDDEWKVLDARTLRTLHVVRPKWPSEFRDNVRAARGSFRYWRNRCEHRRRARRAPFRQGWSLSNSYKTGHLWDHPQLRARNRFRDIGSPAGQLRALLPPGVTKPMCGR